MYQKVTSCSILVNPFMRTSTLYKQNSGTFLGLPVDEVVYSLAFLKYYFVFTVLYLMSSHRTVRIDCLIVEVLLKLCPFSIGIFSLHS